MNLDDKDWIVEKTEHGTRWRSVDYEDINSIYFYIFDEPVEGVKGLEV